MRSLSWWKFSFPPSSFKNPKTQATLFGSNEIVFAAPSKIVTALLTPIKKSNSLPPLTPCHIRF